MLPNTIGEAPQDVSLYMAFPDGALQYVCAECTALCCRGHGYGGSLKREMPVLLSAYPKLGASVVSRRGSMLTLSTPAGSGCVFLDDDNRCRIEKEHGKDLKPGVCMLFPFNKFFRIENIIVVTPHFLCPLRMQVPARPGEVEGSHAKVEAAVYASGLLDPEYISTHTTSLTLHPELGVEGVIKREESFRNSCASALGSEKFTDVIASCSSEPEVLRETTQRAARILGALNGVERHERDEIDDMLMVLAPSHRLSFLLLSSETILRALAISEFMVREITAISGARMSLQGVSSVLGNSTIIARLLARGDETIALADPQSVQSPQFGDAGMFFAAFTALRSITSGSRIFDSLEAPLANLSLSDRSALLFELASYLERLPRKAAKTPRKGAKKSRN